MKETVLVTGASGFLGNNLIRDLLKFNYSVIALVRSKSSTSILKGLDCKIERIGSYLFEDIEKIVSTCDYVIHCASKTDQWTMDYEQYKLANVLSTKALVKASKKHQIKRFILVSSANCFTCGSKTNPGNESSGFMNFFKHSGYAYSKYEAQEYLLKEIKETDFPAIIVAPTFLLGAYDVKPSSGVLTKYVMDNKILFYPNGGKSFVSVSEVSKSVIYSLSHGRLGECYMLSGENVTYKDYYKKVAVILGEKKILIPIPRTLMLLVKSLSKVITTRKFLRLNTNIQALFLENYFTNAKAKKELFMNDTVLDEAIRKTIDWLS